MRPCFGCLELFPKYQTNGCSAPVEQLYLQGQGSCMLFLFRVKNSPGHVHLTEITLI